MSTNGRVEVEFELVAGRPPMDAAGATSEGFAFGFALELATHAVESALPGYGIADLRYGPPLRLQAPRRCRAIVEPSTRRVAVESWSPGTPGVKPEIHLEGSAARLVEHAGLQRVQVAVRHRRAPARVAQRDEVEAELCAAGAPAGAPADIERIVFHDDALVADVRFGAVAWPPYRLHPAIVNTGWTLAGFWELAHGRADVSAPVEAEAVHVLQPGARPDRVWLVQLPVQGRPARPTLALAAERGGELTAVLYGLALGPRPGAALHAKSLAVPQRGELSDAFQGRPLAERRRHCAAYLERWLRASLADFPAGHALPGDVPFRELGVTSSHAVAIAAALGEALGYPVPSTVLFDHPTLDDVVAAIVDGSVRGPSPRASAAETQRFRASSAREPVAVIGAGCRFPGAVFDLDAFWRLLCEGSDAVAPVSRARLDLLGEGARSLRFLGALEDIELFDARFFGISEREACAMDPQQRILLEVTWHALEHAGIPPSSLMHTRTGVFVGAAGNEYARLLAERDAYSVVGNAASVAAGRLSYVLGTRGPSVCIDTACSSSLVAVCMACDSLRQGDADLAIAGGVNLVLDGVSSEGLAAAGALSPRGRCAAFDDAADGYVRGEGCGMVVLRRLSEARARGDRVLAVIRGHAVGHGGRSNGLAAPNREAQAELMTRALERSGVRACDVGYVEAHGTGTTVGDAVELHSLADAYGTAAGRTRPVMIGTAKTHIGHLEAAAGIAGFIKSVLVLERGRLPPNLHHTRPLRSFDWPASGLEVVTELADWAEPGRRLAAVNAFGISGTYAHVVLEAAEPVAAAATPVMEGPVLVPVSGRTELGVRRLAGEYARHLQRTGDMAGLAHAAGAQRDHHDKRAAVVGGSAAQLCRQLEALARGERTVQDRLSAAPAIAFLYSGQGSQYLGMARGLFEDSRAFRDAIEECDGWVVQESGMSCLPLLLGTADPASLDRAAASQPALFCVQYALGRVWESWGIRPDCVLGHSLGEYAAACEAGVLALRDAIALVVLRGQLLDSLPANGAMLVLHGVESEVEALLRSAGSAAEIAAVNAPRQVVVSGDAASIAQLGGAARALGIRTQPLPGQRAFHSRLLDPVLDELERAVAAVSLGPAGGKLISGTLGRPVHDEVCSPAYWREHTRQAVRFASGVEALAARGTHLYVELGPDAVLLPAAAATVKGGSPRWLPSLRKGRADTTQMLRSAAELYVAGARLRWDGLPAASAAPPPPIPGYAFDRRRYWVRDEGLPSARGPYYRVDWVRMPAADAGRTERAGRFVVTGDEAMTPALGAALARAGATVETLPADAAFAGAVASAARAIVYVIAGGGWPGPEQPHAVHAAAVSALQRVLALIKRLPAPGTAAPRLWLVWQRARARGCAADEAIESALFSLARVAGIELPELWGGMAAVHADGLHDEAARVLADALLDGREDQLRIETDHARVPRLVRAPAPAGRKALDPTGAYLVTGGLGHIGLHVARSLADQGVEHLVLTGRRGERELGAEAIGARRALAELRARGVHVRVEAVDVCDERALRELFRGAAPRIAGIFHAAGTRGEVALRDTDAAHLQHVLRAKVQGAWALHELAREFAVEHFVLFSSLASIVGGRGQGAYAAANGFLDGLAAHRRELGMPAVSIAWGPWGGAGGMAAEAPEAPYLQSIGMRQIEPDRALTALRALLHAPEPCWAVADVDWEPFRGVYEARRSQPMFAMLRNECAAISGEDPASSAAALIRELSPLSDAQRLERLHETLKRELRQVLAADHSDQELEQDFRDLGLDSLGAVQLRSRIERRLGIALPSTAVFDHPSLRRLAAALLEAARSSWSQPEAAQ